MVKKVIGEIFLPRMKEALSLAHARGDLRGPDKIFTSHKKRNEYLPGLKSVEEKVNRNGSEVRGMCKEMKRTTRTYGMCKTAEKSLKVEQTRARGIFYSEDGRKLILGILGTVNDIFKLIYPTMMSKNLTDTSKTLFKDRI